ncbi:MAG: DUF1349 domain-containing protein [Maritimibacter sp.]
MTDFTKMHWLNEPPEARVSVDSLEITTAEASDFWQKTYYGFTPDSGHALLTPAPAEFTATLSFAGDYDALYDQAGIMLRAGPELWIKAGVEMSDGQAQFSVVITNGQSDWSTTPLARYSLGRDVTAAPKDGRIASISWRRITSAKRRFPSSPACRGSW